MMRVVLGGAELAGLEISEPAASVRLLVKWPDELFEIPTWNGNEFLLADGRRPALRTFTPVSLNNSGLTLDIVRHGGGAIAGVGRDRYTWRTVRHFWSWTRRGDRSER